MHEHLQVHELCESYQTCCVFWFGTILGAGGGRRPVAVTQYLGSVLPVKLRTADIRSVFNLTIKWFRLKQTHKSPWNALVIITVYLSCGFYHIHSFCPQIILKGRGWLFKLWIRKWRGKMAQRHGSQPWLFWPLGLVSFSPESNIKRIPKDPV